MADYQLTASDMVIRTRDNVNIPNDPANRDRIKYDKWLADGNVPDPYVPPPPEPPPPPAPSTAVLFNHENRLRTFEGVPPITLGDFRTQNGL